LASAAIALPVSASSSLRDATGAPIQVVKHRRSQHRRVSPAARDDNDPYGASSSYGGAYNHNGGAGVDDWGHWSPTQHSGWPCIGNGSDGSETSAYPTWELKPQCK